MGEPPGWGVGLYREHVLAGGDQISRYLVATQSDEGDGGALLGEHGQGGQQRQFEGRTPGPGRGDRPSRPLRPQSRHGWQGDQRGSAQMGFEHAEVRSHADDPPAAALGPHYRCHRSGLLGQIDQDPGPRGRGAGLGPERPLLDPIRGGRLCPLVRRPPGKGRDQLVSALSVLALSVWHGAPR